MVGGKKLDPDKVIASRKKIFLRGFWHQSTLYQSDIEIIEWKTLDERTLYLCNAEGFPLFATDRRIRVGGYSYTAYLKSEFISKLQEEGTADLAELTPEVSQLIEQATIEIKAYFRTLSAAKAKNVVDEWKQDRIYPYKEKAESQLEEVERQVFDIVAVKISQHIPDFASAPQKTQAYQLRMLKQAIETGTDELQLILDEVLNLPPKMQAELADLLKDTSLTNIISSAKIVADRLKFISGLDAVLFDVDKDTLKERSQLHKIIEDNCWIFGEEYNLSVRLRTY